MNRRVIPGAWYGDHLPTGEWCAIVPTIGVSSHLGLDPLLPPGEPWGVGFIRCTAVNGFRFAGQAHSTTNPAVWEWDSDDRAWEAYPPPACGVSPVIYDRGGLLHRSDCGPGVGSQGYRYVTDQNVIISGDATYGPWYGLFEYTDLGDGLWIGQAAYDGGGVQVWDGTTLRQLEPGDCRFVRANRAGDVVALAFTRPEGVVLIQTTMAKLRALPPVTAIEKVPGPIVNEPPKEPPVSATPNRLDIIRAVDAEFPHLLQLNTVAACGEFTERAALRLHASDAGFGLLSKQGAEKQHNGHGIDSIIYKSTQQVVDIIGAAGARDDGDPTTVGKPGWSEVVKRPGNNWMAPIPVDGGPVAPPVTPPIPVSGGGTVPSFEQAKAALVELNRFYKEDDGLGRGKDQFYDLGILDWFARVMAGASVEKVKADIRTFDEWKRRHP